MNRRSKLGIGRDNREHPACHSSGSAVEIGYRSMQRPYCSFLSLQRSAGFAHAGDETRVSRDEVNIRTTHPDIGQLISPEMYYNAAHVVVADHSLVSNSQLLHDGRGCVLDRIDAPPYRFGSVARVSLGKVAPFFLS